MRTSMDDINTLKVQSPLNSATSWGPSLQYMSLLGELQVQTKIGLIKGWDYNLVQSIRTQERVIW
jgi:hypothetical protein